MDALTQAVEILLTTPAVFAACAGVAWGILGGALPGISPSITMALLLPFTYALEPITAMGSSGWRARTSSNSASASPSSIVSVGWPPLAP